MSRTKLLNETPFEIQTFSPKQIKILSYWTSGSAFEDCNGIIADGAIRSGKTMSMSLAFVMWAMTKFTDRNFAICGKTISSCRRNVIKDLKRMLRTRGYKVIDKRSINCLTITGVNGSNDFYIFGGTDERSQDLIQGVTLAGLLLDEVALMPESFVLQATGRCSVEGRKMWFNCNPAGSAMHWFKQTWINRFREKELLYLHFTMDDNPSLSEKMKAQYRSMYVGSFYRRYIEGKWVSAEGVIYDMWDAAQNIYTEDDYPENYMLSGTRYIGVDYGTTNPMVLLDCVDTGSELLIKNEYYYNCKLTPTKAQKTDAQYANDFEEFVGHDHSVTVIIDPSADSFKCELRNRGYRLKDADNTVNDGIRIMSTMIQKRRLKVLKDKTPNFLHEIDAYIWDEKAAEHGEERPVKENDHAMDACRYLCKTLITRRRLQ